MRKNENRKDENVWALRKCLLYPNNIKANHRNKMWDLTLQYRCRIGSGKRYLSNYTNCIACWPSISSAPLTDFDLPFVIFRSKKLIRKRCVISFCACFPYVTRSKFVPNSKLKNHSWRWDWMSLANPIFEEDLGLHHLSGQLKPRGIDREKNEVTASIIFVIALFLVEEPINRFSDPLQRETDRECYWQFILSYNWRCRIECKCWNSLVYDHYGH